MKSIFGNFGLLFAATFLFFSCQQNVEVNAVATFTYEFKQADYPQGITDTWTDQAKMTLVFYEDNTFTDSVTRVYSFINENSSNSQRIYVRMENLTRSSGVWSGDFSEDGNINYTIKKVSDSAKRLDAGNKIISATDTSYENPIKITNDDIPLTDVEEANQVEATAVLSNSTQSLLFNGITYTRE